MIEAVTWFFQVTMNKVHDTNQQLFFLSFEIYNVKLKVKLELDILALERKTTFSFLCLTHSIANSSLFPTSLYLQWHF